ncbi:PspA/IM30 family protein [Lysobacter sp. A378]
MSLFQKLITLFRGTATDAAQKTVDANAIRILDQEMRDAGNELARSRDELTKLMAQGKLLQQKITAREGKRHEYEGFIQGALAKGDESLALDVAARLAPLEAEDRSDLQAKTQMESSVTTLKASIIKAEGQLRGMRQQIDTVKATEAVHRAQATISARHSGANSKMRTALDSLERIQARHLETAARIEAAEELESETGDGDLNKRLAQAGLLTADPDASAILARFKQPQQTLIGQPITAAPVRQLRGPDDDGRA